MRCFVLLLAWVVCVGGAFGEEDVRIELRTTLFDRNEDGKSDRRVKRYVQDEVLVRQIDEDDVNFDGAFDTIIDTFYRDEEIATSFWHNLALGTRGRVYWLDGKQVMIEIDNDADGHFELRMFLDPETGEPKQVFEVRAEGAARPVTAKEFAEYRETFLRQKPIVESAMKDYSKRHLLMNQRKLAAEKAAAAAEAGTPDAGVAVETKPQPAGQE